MAKATATPRPEPVADTAPAASPASATPLDAVEALARDIFAFRGNPPHGIGYHRCIDDAFAQAEAFFERVADRREKS